MSETTTNDSATWTTDDAGYQHDDERCAWQHASGLMGGSGDPSDVTPARLERYVQALNRVADAARAHRAAFAVWHAGGAAPVFATGDELDAALAELPKEGA